MGQLCSCSAKKSPHNNKGQLVEQLNSQPQFEQPPLKESLQIFPSQKKRKINQPAQCQQQESNDISKLLSSQIQDFHYFTKEQINYYNKNSQLFKKNQDKNDQVTEWKIGELIGKGSFGEVWRGLNLKTGELIAIKQIIIGNQHYQIEQKNKALQLEIDMLSSLSHKNIVKYCGMSKQKNFLNIFLEYIAGGSLESFIHKFGTINENIARIYTQQILEGLEYLHVNLVIHRDIKGANVLITTNGVAKLTDFGSAKQIASLMDEGKQFQTLAGTPNWMAPEVIKQSYNGSVGCTVLEMITGKPPYYDCKNQMALMMKIAEEIDLPEIPEQISPELRDFLQKCFCWNPEDRANVYELLQHPFVTGKQSLQQPVADNYSNVTEQRPTGQKLSRKVNKNEEIYFNASPQLKNPEEENNLKFKYLNQIPFNNVNEQNEGLQKFNQSVKVLDLEDLDSKAIAQLVINENCQNFCLQPRQNYDSSQKYQIKDNKQISTIDSSNNQNRMSIDSQINLKFIEDQNRHNFKQQNQLTNILEYVQQENKIQSQEKLMEFIDSEEQQIQKADDIQEMWLN